MENSSTNELAERGTSVAHDVKGQALALLDRGKKRSQSLIRARRRNELLRDLGEVTYDVHLDGDEDASRRDALLAELDELQAADVDTSVE